MDHWLPFQCSISAGSSPPQLCGGLPPTAHTSLADTAATPRNVSSLSMVVSPGFDAGAVATRLHCKPFQCSANGPTGLPDELPTAQTSLAERAATALSSAPFASLV